MDLHFTLTNQLSELHTLEARLAPLGRDWLIDKKTLAALNLVLEELVSNVIEHGARDEEVTMEIRLTKSDKAVTMVFRDDGPAFDPTACPPPDTSLPLEKRRCGGLGIHLVRRFCKTSYSRDNDHNVVTLVKYLQQGE